MSETVYKVVTDRIISLLQAGTVPWHQPWGGVAQMPQNLISRKAYRGINPFVLASMRYGSPFWLTFKQAQEMGGHVRKGEKACPVVFWKWFDAADEDSGEASAGRASGAAGQSKRIPLLRYYSVFNVAQCEGIPADKVPALPGSVREHAPIESAQGILASMPKRPAIEHGRDRAFYSPAFDRVAMPDAERFQSGEDYYSVLFHELTHATGHESRLARKGVSGTDGEWSAFGSTPYAKEELVAEMGAAFLCGHAGIVERTVDQSAAYVANWLERLSNDTKLVVIAAAQAQRAADFILGVKHGEVTESGVTL